MNINDYLRWRGDIPFKMAPFNDVDNAILSMFSYINWTDIVYPDFPVKVEDAWRRYLILHPDTDLNKDKFKMMSLCAASDRYDDCWLMNYEREVNKDLETMFSAITIRLPDRTYFVSFEGTESSIVGWKEDFNMTYMFPVPAQTSAMNYLKRTYAGRFSRYRLGGHSKGGNLAIYAAVMLEKPDHIISVYNNDGPGFTNEFLSSYEYQQIKPKIESLIPQASVIGQLMNNDIDEKIIMTSTRDMAWQHSVFSWEVDVDHFLEADKASKEGMFFQSALNRWNSEMSVEQKMVFMNTFYDTLVDLGIKDSRDLLGKKMAVLKAFMNKAARFDDSTRRIILDVMKALFQSNISAFYNTYLDKVVKRYERKQDQ